MFYYLSKIVWFCLQPSSVLLLLLIAGALLVRYGRTMAGMRCLTSGLAGFAVIGLSPLADVIAHPLEARFPRPELGHEPVHGIIVLGGAEDPNPGARELMSLNDAGERLTEAVALARRYAGARLIFSGGTGALLRKEISAAERASGLFEALGVEQRRIVLEDRSRTTEENARFSHELLNPQRGERWLLVTSAWHMPRAVGCFRKVGFDVVAWPVDYRTSAVLDVTHVFASVPDGLRRFDLMAKEYVGLLAYRLTGRIDSIFPGPRGSAP